MKDLDPQVDGVQTEVRSEATVLLIAPPRPGLIHLRITRDTLRYKVKKFNLS